MLQEKANVCLIMELAKGGNLHQRIKDPAKPRLCYKEVLQVCLCALNSCCGAEWVHVNF